MLIKQIKLNNYRNYTNATIPLHPNLNIITGPNGVGKTNILESIIVVSNTKSFRTNKDDELIKFNEEYSKIEAQTDKNTLKIVLNQTGKSLFINNEQIKKASDFIGKLNAILFKPADLELFSTSPKERRRLLDIEISKVDKNYLSTLLTYNKLLKDKNKLLKENNIDTDYLDLIEEKMVPCIIEILKKREEFFEEINKNISKIYSNISNTESNIEIIYNKCSSQEDVIQELFNSRERDLFYKYSTFGPHHDDYYFNLNNYELNSIASQGQKRMVFIALKLALIKYIKNKINELPIILLDDVLSELDDENKKRLLNILPKNTQIIITDTNIEGIDINDEYNLIELKEI